MKPLFVAIALMLSATAFAEPYSDYKLEDVLTQAEMKAIGLVRLSAAEQEQLRVLIIEKYLAGYEKGKSDGIEAAAEYLASQQSAGSGNVIESQIDGDFEGWEGETIVKLMNGQIWQQSEYYYTYHYAFMPKVLVYKSGAGYKMKVDGVSKEIGVVRLK